MPSINDTQNYELWQKAKHIFLPYTSIKLVELFRGRRSEIQRVTTALGLPGRHVVLFGDRGVGKTSLANLVSFFADWDDDQIFSHSCGSRDTFKSIFDSVFKMAGDGLLRKQAVKENVKKIGAAKLGLQDSKRDTFEPIEEFKVDANSVFETLQGLEILVILDEFDRVTSDDAKLEISELVKKLSDVEAKSKLLVVGVARTIVDLIGMHPSAVRCFEQVEMPRMPSNEIEEILTCGFNEIGFGIGEELVQKVAALADGYPHFAHLIGLKLVEASLNRLMKEDESPLTIVESDYLPAIQASIEGSVHSLKDAYLRGTETPGVKTSMYKWILEGIAIQDEIDVPLPSILDYLNNLNPDKLRKAQAISPHLGKLVNNRDVLDRPRTGFYRFEDPMLRAFVRMHIAEKKLDSKPAYRQLTLDFA